MLVKFLCCLFSQCHIFSLLLRDERRPKKLALLQAKESACVLELGNVPNMRWLFALSMYSPNIHYSILSLC